MNCLGVFVVFGVQVLFSDGEFLLELEFKVQVTNSFYSNSAQSTLHSEINQVLSCINKDKMQEISREYFENDSSVQLLFKYLSSQKFNVAWEILTTSPEIEDIFEWMGNHGVNVVLEIKLFAEEVKQICSGQIRRRMIQGFSIKSYEEEMKEQINFVELSDKIDEMFKAGNDFTQLYLILSVTRTAIEKIFEKPEIQQIVDQFKTFGIDLESLRAFLYETLRWN
jgi:Insect allergen related repeat, nitrile-specifier detoxification